MKKLLIILACSCAVFPAAAQGIEFLDQPAWKDVLGAAAKRDRLIFMDCYTEWCGPCKLLARDVFTQPEAGEFFNANFINVKYDMEKGEGRELYERYKPYIVGFPTMLLIDAMGNVVHQMAGYQRVGTLIAGMKAGMEGRSLFAMRARYDAGERDVDFLTGYVAVLGDAFLKDDMEKVVVDYMRSLPPDSLLSPKIWALAGDYVKDVYSLQFEYVLRNIDRLVGKSGTDGYKLERQLSGALDRAVARMIGLRTDGEKNAVSLTDDPAGTVRLKELIDIANLKRAETQKACLLVHELKLAGEWRQVLDHMDRYYRIGAMGYSNRFAVETIHYMALNTTDESILRQGLAKMEEIRRAEDDPRGGSGHNDVMAALWRALGDDIKAAEYQALYDEYRRKVEAEWEEMLKNAKQ